MGELSKAEVNLDENEVKILVLKLMQIEKLLREVRKKKKKNALDPQGALVSNRAGSRFAKVAPVGSRNAYRVGSLKTTGHHLGTPANRQQSALERADRSHVVNTNVRSSLDKKSGG
jgi:hypothetical protein